MVTQTSPASSHVAAVEAAAKAAGGAKRLATILGIEPSAVSNWRKTGIPPARVQAVSRITGIPIHNLRPDVFDPPKAEAAAQPQVAA